MQELKVAASFTACAIPPGRHLAASIHTGMFCSYEPERTIVWSVHANMG
jgi:hypothetical protein